MEYHSPVLLSESVDALNLKPNGVYVDVTFGGGGHSREILKRLGEGGRLFAFDQDPDALVNRPVDLRFKLIHQNFRYMKNWLSVEGITQVDGILADLGVSSHQFDSQERGFSIRYDAALDMRMDVRRTNTATKVVNEYEHGKLAQVLRQYGEVDQAGVVANAIMSNRPIYTTTELLFALERFAPRAKEHKFFAQVFQALRIEVNEELEALKEMLKQSVEVLKTGGRLVVISYHSLEDRLVKDFLKTGNFEGEPQKDFYGNLIRPMKPITTKPVLPNEKEIEENNRARSAKMRIGEKV